MATKTKTDIVDIAARAFAAPPAEAAAWRSLGRARGHRRSRDRGILWVRLTLLVVVSTLLLSIGVRSRLRAAASAALPGTGSAPSGR
jgi:hypothetical protein